MEQCWNYIRLSLDLSIPLPVLLSGEVIPHRICCLYFAYYEREFEVPNRADFYAMQIAMTVDNQNRKKGSRPLKFRDYQIAFENKTKKPKNKEAELKKSQSRWAAILGVMKKQHDQNQFLNSEGIKVPIKK